MEAVLRWDQVKEYQQQIEDLIIEHVKENSCCRVGWACKQILKREVQPNVVDKLAAHITEQTKYKKEPANIEHPYDWNIINAPKESPRKVTWKIITEVVAAIGVASTFWFAYQSHNEGNIIKELKAENDSLKSIRVSSSHIPTNIAPSTTYTQH